MRPVGNILVHPVDGGANGRSVLGESASAPTGLNFRTNFAIALVTPFAGWLAIAFSPGDDPALHTVLDTSVALTGALIALLLWDVSRRVDDRGWA